MVLKVPTMLRVLVLKGLTVLTVLTGRAPLAPLAPLALQVRA